MNTALLHIDQLCLAFGGLQVLEGLSLQLQAGEILGLLGPNGAGKSTLLNCLSGYHAAQSGIIRLLDKDIQGLAPHEIARLGLGRSFQQPRLFGEQTVAEHGYLGGMRHGSPSLTAVFVPSSRQQSTAQEARVRYWLDSLGLTPYADLPARRLSYGLQKRVDLFRAVAMEPRLLLLDEPAAGLNEGEQELLLEILLSLRSEHQIAMIVVEHRLNLVRALTDRIAVLHTGHIIADGSWETVSADPQVQAVYLSPSL